MSCPFCNLVSGNNGWVLGNERFRARLDIHPVSPGHLLLIPVRHVRRLSELNGDEWEALSRIRRQAESFAWNNRQALVEAYQKMFKTPATPNSGWFAQKALALLKSGAPHDGFNHGVNEGEAAGQTVKHLHWHVIPRYRGDMPDPSGGVRYVIPELGNYRAPRA